MRVSLPVLVHDCRDGEHERYRLRPAFARMEAIEHEDLERGLAKLARAARRHAHHLAQESRHDELAAFLEHPLLEDQRLRLELELRDRVLRERYLVLSGAGLGGRVVWLPDADCWFQLAPGEDLHRRCGEVLLHAVAGLPRDEQAERLRGWALRQDAWLTTIDFDLPLPRLRLGRDAERWAQLFAGEDHDDGAWELLQVGDCLDQRYPQQLQACLLREAAVDSLQQVVAADPPRPVVLLGPPGCGKTSLIHGLLQRQLAALPGGRRQKGQFWHLSPARLIAGMMYVGQWEQRLLAIADHLVAERHVLVLDDLIGLFRAGRSASGDLSVGQVLKGYLQQGRLRVVAEASWERWQLLREIDRGFTDLFHVIPLEPTDAATTRRLTIALARQLEDRHRCAFEPEALPAAIDLVARFVRGRVLPGSVADLLERIALGRREQTIAEDDVLGEFARISGLALGFLDDRTRLDRETVLQRLRARISGQDTACAALADAVTVAKARLNDRDRPLQSCLFLGPTGVGKTETAKALAEVLYGSQERILRFDLNEFVGPDAAIRLIGAFGGGEGRLTGALRRQPFSVLLLDEIEKAHPDVHDLLLQVLGEGRLTDGNGETCDFTGSVIIMTSNLGVREAGSELGFTLGGRQQQRRQRFLDAVEDFFRPEFVNRIDRIIPFDPLGDAETAQIAERLLERLLARDGIARRRCLIRVSAGARQAMVAAGHDPALGARALRRALEQGIGRPLARVLAATPPGSPTCIRIGIRDGALHSTAQVIEQVPALCASAADGEDPQQRLQRCQQGLDTLDQRLEARRPAIDALDAEAHAFYVQRESLGRLRRQLERLRQQRGHALPTALDQSLLDHATGADIERPQLHALFAQQDLGDYLRELAQRQGEREDDWARGLRSLELHLTWRARCLDAATEGCIVWSGSLGPSQRSWLALLREVLDQQLDLVVEESAGPLPDSRRWQLSGPGAASLAAAEYGTQLFHGLDGQLESLVAAAGHDEEAPLPPAIRIHDGERHCLDLRSGEACSGRPSPARLRHWLLLGLAGGDGADA